jgi:TonB family protein
MKKTLLITCILFSFITVKAQDTDTVKRIFTSVEVEPTFPGGIEEFYRYLQANVKYPPDAKKNRLEGKVFISFVVERDGSLTNSAILRGVSPDIDAEALRVVNNSPKWKPGIQNGRPVRVQYSIPLNFKLPSEAEQRRIDSLKNLPPDQKIFTAVEHEPEFKGGMQAFYKYLSSSVHYPADAVKNHIQGKVFISFIVEKDGSLSDLKIVRSVSPDLDAETMRVIKASPNWNPGTQNGKPVRVAYTMPMSFTLEGR